MSPADEYIRLLWESGALLVREEPYPLKSGNRSYVYANHRDLICIPDHLGFVANSLLDVIRGAWTSPFALSSVDSFVSPFLVAAAALQGPYALYTVRPASREKGVSDEVFSYEQNTDHGFEPHLPAVLVDDVVTTEKTLRYAAGLLAEHGVQVLGAVCLLDRRVKRELTAATIDVVPVARLADALEFGLANLDLSTEQQRLVEIELSDLET